MRMNRRNVLVGLGTIVAGGGGALATGAFSSVEADRDITVSTTGDNGAYLGLSVDNSNIASGADTGQLTLTIDALNENALTRFDGVFTVTNNGNDGVGIKIEELDSSGSVISNNAITWESNTSTQDLESYPTVNGDDHNLQIGDTCQVDIEIDGRNTDDPTNVDAIRISASADQFTS